MSDRVSRRALLVGGGGLLLAGCGSASSVSRATGSRAVTTTATGTPKTGTPATGTRTSTRAALPLVTGWQPSSKDVTPAAKVAAVRRIERDGNTASTVLQVIDVQYGGILTDSASVLVVCRSWHRKNDEISEGGATYDVRLSRSSSGWRVTAINPSRPGGAASALPGVARDVLASKRIALPPAAHADVKSGQVHASVLTAMLTLAETYRIGVSLVRSGHPIYVFGTDRLSDHPRGRAFDTWQIDGRAVVDPDTSRRLVTGYMEAATAAGSYNVGGPYLLGSAPQYFSDNTHHDHVHAGFPS